LVGNRRAVVFLDPFGNSVKWTTIEAIAAVEKIDLWYLFPSGIGVVRQISRDTSVQKDAEGSLDEMFGTTNWRDSFSARMPQPDIFDPDRETSVKIATADAVTRYMIARMKTVFKGSVLDRWLPLGKKGGHWYSLIFACSNPSSAARNLATRVANDIMRRK
jgi:three-Cys-motif partner protein